MRDGSVGRMKTINEDDGYFNDAHETRGGASMLSKNYSNAELDPHNRSTANILEESIADPQRPPQHIRGLTDFLTEEYFKRFGIYTSDARELQKFWKNHVSAVYKQMREEKAKLKNQTSYGADFGAEMGFDVGFGGYSDLGMPGKGQYTVPKPKGKSDLLKSNKKPPPP